MFEIQENHVRKILIVALTNGLKLNASMTNVSNIVKTLVMTIITANGKIIVWTISVFHDAKTIKIVQMVNFVPEEDVFLDVDG